MIRANELSLRYADGTEAVRQFSLEIAPGQLVYITGPSGSGKTSLLKLFLGMEIPTSGSLSVLGTDIGRSRVADIRRMRTRIGPVFQEFRLIRGRNALDNVILGMRFLAMEPREIRMSAAAALEKVGLQGKANSRVENLSWGECQRVAIARAMARKPALILADEPTGNLDHDNAVHILELLTSCRDSRTTVVITTHATHLIDENKEAMLIRILEGRMAWQRLG